MTKLTTEQERYAVANQQLLEVATYLLSNLKSGHTTTEISAVTIDELLELISLVTHVGVGTDYTLRPAIAREVRDLAERTLPAYA